MAGIVSFEHTKSSWAASNGVFMRAITSIVNAQNGIQRVMGINLEDIEANMRLDLSDASQSAIAHVVSSVENSLQDLLTSTSETETKGYSSGYIISLADLKAIATFNFCKQDSSAQKFMQGSLGAIQYLSCKWSAPQAIFDHLLERLAGTSVDSNGFALTKVLLKARVQHGTRQLDLMDLPLNELNKFIVPAILLVQSYISQKGLRYSDDSLFNAILPYSQSLIQFLFCGLYRL